MLEKLVLICKSTEFPLKKQLEFFSDGYSLTIHDPLHSDDEERFVIIGISYKNRLLVVVHTERNDNIRIISARKATQKERVRYESNG